MLLLLLFELSVQQEEAQSMMIDARFRRPWHIADALTASQISTINSTNVHYQANSSAKWTSLEH